MLGIRLAEGGRRFAASRLVCRTAFFGDADCNRAEAGRPVTERPGRCWRQARNRGPILAFPSAREAPRRGTRVDATGCRAPGSRPAPCEYRQQGAMALTRSISRLDLAPMPQTVGEVVERDPLLALSQRKLNALGTAARLRRPQPALSLRQQGVPRLARQARRRGARPRGHRGRSAATSTSSTTRTSTRRSAASAPASSASSSTPGRPPIWIRVDYYPDRNPQGHIRGFLVDLQRRRPPEAARARGGSARAPAAPRHRQRRPADPLFRSPAHGCALPTSRSPTGSACRPTT